MNFQYATNYLKSKFNEQSFEQLVQQGRHHQASISIQKCQNGSEIHLIFPGYKSKVTPRFTVYDYRVDLHKDGFNPVALSHSNIIIDIYNKVVYGGMSIEKLYNALINITLEGDFELESIRENLIYTPQHPSEALKNKAKKAHGKKNYNQNGNSFDLDIEELIASIKWIMLQEDINYPIAKGFLGRKMSLARYIETLFVTQNNSYSLTHVIQRALSHERPVNWKEIDYRFLDKIT